MTKILYQDTFLAVVVKPAGLVSEEGGSNSLPTLLTHELNALTGKEVTLYTVHRLDRDTEGIMVYALTSSAAAKLSADIAQGKWAKTYTALLWGVPKEKSGRLCDLIYYDRSRGKSFVVTRERKGVKQAVLNYSVISSQEKTSLVKIKLETGRTHQIRVQFASRGLPLCGDRRYGAPPESGKSLALCASRLSFRHPETGEGLEFEIEPSNIQSI